MQRPHTPSVVPMMNFWPWHETRCWISLILNGELYFMEWDLRLQKPISCALSSPEKVTTWCVNQYGRMGYEASIVFITDCLEKGYSNATGFHDSREIIKGNKAGYGGATLSESELVEMYLPREHPIQ